MSPQLYPTPPHPTENGGSQNPNSQSSPSSNPLWQYRWPLLFTSYLVVGGVPSIPSVQQRLNPRTVNLLGRGSLAVVVLGAVGLMGYEVLGTEMQRRGAGKVSVSVDRSGFGHDDDGRNGSESQLSEHELQEKRKIIEREGLQRD